MSRHAVDWPKVLAALDATCSIRKASYRDVAKQIGISPSGLTRLRQGKHLEADALAALTAWLYPGQIPRWVRKVPCPTCLDRLPPTWHCTECGAGTAPRREQNPTDLPPGSAQGATGVDR